MWNEDEDVQVIKLDNEIELLPNYDSKPYINEELCQDILSKVKVKENVNKLHLQTIKNKLNSNVPEVDVEYKVTNGSLNQQKNKGNYTIKKENIEIKKKIKQENEDEIQDAIIKIKNNNLRVVDIDDNEINDQLDDGFNLSSFIDLKASRQSSNDFSTDIHPKITLAKEEDIERDLIMKYLKDLAINRCKPVVKIDLSKKFKGDKIYPICSKPRGYCLIINNVDFRVYEQRKGSDLEAEYLKDIFTQLNFEILYYRNLTSLGMLDCFKNIVKREELKYHDTFVSIILTHGDDSKVLVGTDASRLKIDSILHQFTNANCPYLENKPKLFFIQACRGTNHDFGIYDQATVSDAVPVKASNSTIRKEIKDLNRLNDVLIVNSTLDGFVSLRNEISGSWFGDALGYALCEYSKDLELQKLLSLVNRKILDREKGDVQQAIECNYIGFRRGFYFNPGHFFEKNTI